MTLRARILEVLKEAGGGRLIPARLSSCALPTSPTRSNRLVGNSPT